MYMRRLQPQIPESQILGLDQTLSTPKLCSNYGGYWQLTTAAFDDYFEQ